MIKVYKDLVKRILYILDSHQKRLAVGVFLAIVIGSFLECLGVSAIIPLINVILAPEALYQSSYYEKLTFLHNLSYSQLVMVIVCGVIALYIFKNSFFMFQTWLRSKFSNYIQRSVSIKMMESYMSRGYQFFLSRGFGQISRSVGADVDGLFSEIFYLFKIISDILTMCLIVIVMVVTDWQISLALCVLAIFCVLLMYFVFKKNMSIAGAEMRKYNAITSQAFVQAFQGVKDVMIMRKQKFFVQEYNRGRKGETKARVKMSIGSDWPQYIIEAIMITGLMLVVGIRIGSGQDGTDFIASLAVLALGAFRILPALGRVSMSINIITQYENCVISLYNDLIEAEEYAKNHPESDYKLIEELPEKAEGVTNFNDKVELRDITFAYINEADTEREENSSERVTNVLNNINMTINKSQSIAFVGPSGAGKSTIIDVLLGLLVPQNGGVYMDGKNITEIADIWAQTVGYVPQQVFLTDGTIMENVAFGVPKKEIDQDRVKDVLKKAELLEFINSLPDGINTYVGDRGVRLSGGQRQRIAIARALYRRPELLVLDEATSALDNETESAIMEAIDSLHGYVTMIIVAHRLTTVKNCDLIYEVKDGTVTLKDKAEVLKGI